MPTAGMGLQTVALDLGLAVNHSPYDCLYVAFAMAVGADRVVAADAAFVRAMRSHPSPAISGLLLPLDEWDAHQSRQDALTPASAPFPAPHTCSW